MKFSFNQNQNYSLILTYSEFSESIDEIDINLIKNELSLKKLSFNNKFNKIFPSFSNENCSRASLSNLLGGILYQYGGLNIKNDYYYTKDMPLLTSTPSRNYFPRGFLWDEGFHNIIICQWDSDLSLLILKTWFETEIKGWIPREQVRGIENEMNFDSSFPQNKNEANPPTFMLPLLYLLNYFELNNMNNPLLIIRNFLPILKNNFFWFINSQKSDIDDLYSWRIKEDNYNFGSGLDDYPRNDDLFESKYHLDLQIWVIFYAKSMMQLCEKFDNDSDCEIIRNKYFKSLINLDKFLDKSDNYYKDIGYNIKDGYVDNSRHIGYLNVFPIFFGLIDINSLAFENILNLLNDEYGLKSQFGIRSLSKRDDYFHKNDDYWTGNIWININYLILRGLKLYYWKKQRVKDIYTELRNNIIKNVCGEWENTGYFWENYNEKNGFGDKNRAKPFNGWTSLITIIISEKYI